MKKSMKNHGKFAVLFVALGFGCMAASAANYTYQGGGVDPNEWFDDLNWSDAGGAASWPTAADNALFTVANKNMTISQVVPEHAQFQVGRGNATTNSGGVIANSATIVAGGVVTNSGQTVVGILNKGRGTLVIDGGSLVTPVIQINVAGGTAGQVPDPASIMQVKSGSVEVGSGNVLLGPNAPGTLEISGGSMVINHELRFYDGYLDIIGAAGMLDIGTVFNWGMQASKTSEVAFMLGSAGGVSTITADSISFVGTQSLVVDGSLTTVGTAQNLVLIDLVTDTFSPAEFAALTNALSLVNMADGALSLSGDSHQLLFTGTPIPFKLTKNWEFNTAGNTEGFTTYSLNSHLVGLTVTNAINGSESVLTCADIAGNDPQFYYNQGAANSALFIPAGGGKWRTLEMRLRQINANPDEVGVVSQPFNISGTLLGGFAPGFINLAGITPGPFCTIEAGADNWIVATYDISSFGTNDLRALRVDPIGGASSNSNFEVDYIRIYSDELNYGVNEPATIISSAVVAGGLLKLEINAPTPALSYLKSRSNLVFGSWTNAPHSDNAVGPFVFSNLTYSTASGTNVLIYVQTDEPAEFFGIGPE
ncbi:MAG: hypothetical protein K9M54_04035 [Kiritimatiellales bacterium]|nr:hypothetical protein [Kiritimatiellales bacterium]